MFGIGDEAPDFAIPSADDDLVSFSETSIGPMAWRAYCCAPGAGGTCGPTLRSWSPARNGKVSRETRHSWAGSSSSTGTAPCGSPTAVVIQRTDHGLRH